MLASLTPAFNEGGVSSNLRLGSASREFMDASYTLLGTDSWQDKYKLGIGKIAQKFRLTITIIGINIE